MGKKGASGKAPHIYDLVCSPPFLTLLKITIMMMTGPV